MHLGSGHRQPKSIGGSLCGLVIIGLILGLVTPAHTKGASCSPPRGASSRSTALTVTDKHTEGRPLEVTFDQPAAVLFVEGPSPIGDARIETPIRIASATRYPDLHVRAEWPTPSVTDLDLFLWNRWGEPIRSSESWNIQPLDDLDSTNTGGPGYEYIKGAPVEGCGRYTVMTGAWHTPGEKVTLRLWLGSES